MTKYVLISDIHGNVNSVESVIQKEGKDCKYFVLGDLMGLLAQPSETVSLIQELDTVTVLQGNHDISITKYNEGHVMSEGLSKFEKEHTLSELSDDDLEWISGLPSFDVVNVDGERICATHAMPWPEEASGYEEGNSGISKKDLPHVASKVGDEYSIVMSGHTHQQYEQDCSKFGHSVTFVNSGTLGYDGNYATFDSESGEVELKSVEIDDDHLKEHIKSVLPEYAPPVSKWYNP